MNSLTITPEMNRISGMVISAAYDIHVELGPGLLESVYHACMLYELRERGLQVRSEVCVPITYKSVQLPDTHSLRIDMIVENVIAVELKAVTTIHPVYVAQLLTYMKLLKSPIGLLINFNVPRIKDGIKRLAL